MSIEVAMEQNWLPGSFTLARFSTAKVVSRDRLISMLLQDRGVLRIISAPHGYGKSFLAYEYARRVFSESRVVWVDGSSSEFIRALDEGHLVPPESGSVADGPGLVVLDDMMPLDETRMETLGRCVDELLSAGNEIIVTTLPSCDFLRSSQPDRVLITAGDLLVTEKDIAVAYTTSSAEERNGAFDLWHKAQDSLMGCAPCSMWGSAARSDEDWLVGFFEEDVPVELHKAAFAMLLLGKGSFEDLRRIGAELSDDLVHIVAKDYPFLGVDSLQGEFKVGNVPARALKEVLSSSSVGEMLLAGAFPVQEKAIGVLIETGSVERAGQVMEAFCTSDNCEAWLESCGWKLLDCGEVRLLDVLLERCERDSVRAGTGVLALRAWTSGMRGDDREAVYYARDALRFSDMETTEERPRATALMALLALAAFGGDIEDGAEWLKSTGQGFDSPAGYLVCVASLCSREELTRSVAIARGEVAGPMLPSNGVEPDELRVEKLAQTVVEGSRRFATSAHFRLSLHMLASVNDDYARSVLHECACGVLVAMHKRGVETYTQAAVVADLWKSGYFGVGGKMADVKDSKTLALASGLLMKMNRVAGREAPAIPWEQRGRSRGVSKAKEKTRKRQSRKLEQAPVANVRLFGGIEVSVGEKYIAQNRWTRRSLQLFAILVMSHGKDVSRDVIFQQMWPDLPRARALDNFYTAWSRMSALLGEGPYVSRRGEFCSVSSRYVVSDVAEFEQLSRRVLIERDDIGTILDIFARMETLYHGGLLPGEKGNEYIDSQRLKYKTVFVDAMVSGVYKGLEAKDARIALWFARKAMEEDPTREDVYVATMRAQMEAGQRCSAIRTYLQCAAYLREELGLDPSVQTRGLYEQLIASDPTLVKLVPASFAIR